jgi:L-2-hydroxyglutarate oxidase LhgO
MGVSSQNLRREKKGCKQNSRIFRRLELRLLLSILTLHASSFIIHPSVMPDCDIAIIGAGVVGLSIAARLSKQYPNLILLEKNSHYGMETSSRNSEVIHAGIYYTPGSLKARLCVEGRDELYSLCQSHSIAHRQITKIITATNAQELEKLDAIYENGRTNGVPLERLTKEQTLAREPNINTAGSLYSPMTGIISAHELMDYFAHAARANGATVQLRCEVMGIRKEEDGYALTINDQGKEYVLSAERVVNAAGLYADRIAAMVGIDIDRAGYRLSYAKGSYFAVAPKKAKIVSRLIYPVPMNESLGVHALLDWGGRLKFGPDAEYLPDGLLEYSVSEDKRTLFAEAIRRIVPGIEDDDLTPDMAGIRPKLQKKGEAPKDFLIASESERGLEGFINLIGIESPGLTASPAIARHVEELLK